MPDTAPAYDDATPAQGRSKIRAAESGAGRAAPGPDALPARRTRAGLTLVTGAEGELSKVAHVGRPAEAGAWPGQFAQVLAETLSGARPAGQLVPWTTEQARKRISQLGPLLATSHRPRIRRVIVTSPAQGVLEMTVIVALGASVRALAVRLERAKEPGPGKPAWLCTAIEAA